MSSSPKNKLQRPLSHRWMEDFDYFSKLSPEEQEYLRRFTYEYYYNTYQPDPDKQIHKGGKESWREDGWGIYKAYNDAERDLYAKIQYPTQNSFHGIAISASDDVMDTAVYDGDNEDLLISQLDSEEDVDEMAGTSAMDLEVTVTRADGTTVQVIGTTFLNRKGILVRDVRAKNPDLRVYPDDRDIATKLLREARNSRRRSEGNVEVDPWGE